MAKEGKMGQRIDDHSFWAGKGGKDSVLPGETRVKSIGSAECAGDLARYEDTEMAIRGQQDTNARKAKSHDMKSGYRY